MSEPKYHDDAACGSCGGPLEVSRDAVCETCAPESLFWETAAALQTEMEANDER